MGVHVRKVLLGAGIALAFVASSAQAALVKIAGSGMWDAGGAWSISFLIEDPLQGSQDGHNFWVTSGFSDFHWSSTNSVALETPTDYRFWDEVNNGAFDVELGPHSQLAFYGDDMGSDGTLELGAYDVRLSGPGGSGVITLTQAAGGAPEPTSWALMILGLGAAGGAVRARSRRRIA
jgi:hypothetical protein